MSAASAADTIFEGLNPAQRRAVAYGLGTENGIAPPLLIAAGAGTGKTKTLAHRVARLILGGVDSRRLLLLTFTRRAAQEMTRRAQHILAASRGGATIAAEAELLPWSGTFHSIGNRLLRQYAASLALNPAFTVLDRTDSADLMDVVRNDLGLARARSRFPQKGTCLAIYSYTVNAGCPLAETLADFYPWCDEWEAELKWFFAGYVAAKQRDNVLDYDDLLLYWREAARMPAIAAQMRAEFDHILVDEYQDTGRHSSGAGTRWQRPYCGRRRRSVDLRVPSRDGAQHPRFSGSVLASGSGDFAGTQLPFDPADPRCGECRHGSRQRGLCQNTDLIKVVRRAALPGHRRRRGGTGPLCRGPGAGAT
jgi:hypothetical protein